MKNWYDAIVIDFETYDPLLKKYGSGAVFKYHYPEMPFEVLGAGICDGKVSEYINFTNDIFDSAKANLRDKIINAPIWVMHNSLYDLAILKFLGIEKPENTLIVDSMLLAKLYDQTLKEKIKFSMNPYSLDALCKFFKLEDKKQSDDLCDYAWLSGLYQRAVTEKTGRGCHTKPKKATLNNWVMGNLNKFASEVVGKYCVGDCVATWGLYLKLIDLIGDYDLTELSDIITICLKMKFKGVKIDLKACVALSETWKKYAIESEATFKLGLGLADNTKVNVGSNAQIGPLLVAKGYKINKTLIGNYSITKDWLEEQDDALLNHLRRMRKAKKAEKDFIQKILKYQEIIPEKYRLNKDIGIMFPSIKPLGATATGRFSSGGGTGSCELNMLAISSHDEEFGVPVRKLFLPSAPDEKIICCDFSNQEPRLQVHYAKLLNCAGTEKIIETWHKDPKTKYHQIVADMTKLEYSVAKMVTLGLAYDMRAWGLSQKLGVSMPRAEQIIAQYHKLLPFMAQLQAITSSNLKRLGYIKTIGGRKLVIDPPYEYKGDLRTQERKGMSKLIQGSGLDQLWRAMIKADRAGISILLPVHDEIVASSKNPVNDLNLLTHCMETAYTLVVPVVADGGIGDNWGDAKP